MRCWIAVASAEHVRFGRSAGFMQVCHGKGAPLRRVQPGDCVAYYSPAERFKGAGALKAFTAIGIVKDGAAYQAEMGGGFRPFRRDVRWLDAEEAPIRPLLERLAFARARKNWGYRLRLGLFEIGADDMTAIAAAMAARLPPARGGQRAWPRGGDCTSGKSESSFRPDAMRPLQRARQRQAPRQPSGAPARAASSGSSMRT